MPLLIFAALIIPTLRGRAEISRRYVLAVTIALLITAALFAIWPANGPWAVYGFAPSKAQAEFISDLLLLKSGQPARIDLVSSAIVTFPSFHTVLAILSVVALWESGRARWFVFALGTAICISTLTTGWHFFIDVIGGICVAWRCPRLLSLGDTSDDSFHNYRCVRSLPASRISRVSMSYEACVNQLFHRSHD